METFSKNRHMGPHPGVLAIIFTILFNVGLSFVISSSEALPHYPGPWESAETIAAYFQHYQHDVIMCAFLQFAAAIPLGLLTASIVSRLGFLGTTASGKYIALFGGFMASFAMALSAMIPWVMSYPGIADEVGVNRALYYMGFAIGGAGYSVPLGLLFAGISVTSAFMKLLPKWLIAIGLLLALSGILSTLSMVFPKLLFFIPLTRFPGFIWLIIVGFMLPKVKKPAVLT